ncbi:MAG: hypothetical protein ACYTGV_10345 [Planctomycetota bacterium]|jgi:hypothetical protein
MPSRLVAALLAAAVIAAPAAHAAACVCAAVAGEAETSSCCCCEDPATGCECGCESDGESFASGECGCGIDQPQTSATPSLDLASPATAADPHADSSAARSVDAAPAARSEARPGSFRPLLL